MHPGQDNPTMSMPIKTLSGLYLSFPPMALSGLPSRPVSCSLWQAKISRESDATVCMHLCIGVQEDSSYIVYRGLHLWSCFLRSWCLGLSDFPFLQKEGIQTGNPWTQIQIKQLSTG